MFSTSCTSTDTHEKKPVLFKTGSLSICLSVSQHSTHHSMFNSKNHHKTLTQQNLLWQCWYPALTATKWRKPLANTYGCSSQSQQCKTSHLNPYWKLNTFPPNKINIWRQVRLQTQERERACSSTQSWCGHTTEGQELWQFLCSHIWVISKMLSTGSPRLYLLLVGWFPAWWEMWEWWCMKGWVLSPPWRW